METWQKTSLILCVFGLLKELRPSESFITEYFIGFKNVTSELVIHDLFPVGTYTVLAASLVIFLVTDFLRYRPIVIFQGFSFVLCWLTLIWGQSFFLMQMVQVFYGFALSADVAYYTYMYAQVDKDHYRQVTSYTYTASLTGKFLAGFSGQILISFRILDFHGLVFITLSTALGAFLVSICLPVVQKSIYFNRIPNTVDEETNQTVSVPLRSEVAIIENGTSVKKDLSFSENLKRAYHFLWIDFKDAYSKSYVLKWSIWWAFANAGNLQIVNYNQALWEKIDSFEHRDIYNGAVGAGQCLLGAILTFGVGHVKISWKKWGESFLFVSAILQGLILIVMSQTESLNIAYACFMGFRIIYQLVITVASSEVAQGIRKDSCGLVFGVNTFFALIIQTIITIVVTDKRGLALDERTQFFVYGSYFLVLGMLFAFIVIYTVSQNIRGTSHSKKQESLGKCVTDI